MTIEADYIRSDEDLDREKYYCTERIERFKALITSAVPRVVS
ncbi:MAG: hypothetical protein ABI045_05050 [Flavobacteriales bacterium]